MKIIPEITDERYDKLLEHSNEYLNKSNIEKREGKLFIYVKFGIHRKPYKVELVAPRDRDGILSALYKDPKTAKNGRDSFFLRIRELYANIPRTYVLEWLQKQELYQLHLQQPREKVLRPNVEKKINSRWQIDLISMKDYKSPRNRNKAYVLTTIDCFSKYAIVRAMPNKKGITTKGYLEEILEEIYDITGEYPTLIQSDNGKEFISRDVKELCEKYKIKQIFSPPYMPQAQGIIERFNKTLKQHIFQNFTRTGKREYVDYLSDILDNYNNTVHNSTKDTPQRLFKKDKISMKQQKLIDVKKEKWIKSTRIYEPLDIGDKVRVHILTDKTVRKDTFAKKFVPQWSKEVYKVEKIIGEQSAKVKPTYQLYYRKNGKKVIINRRFYRHDLQKVRGF